MTKKLPFITLIVSAAVTFGLAAGCSSTPTPAAVSPPSAPTTSIASSTTGPEVTAPPAPRPTVVTVADRALTPAVTPAEFKEAAGLAYGQCIHDATDLTPKDTTVSAKTDGPVTGMIGDSLTTQIRDQFAADPTRQWTVWSRCGSETSSVDRDAAVSTVLSARPKTLVVALGTNDANFEDPKAGSADGFDQRAASIIDRAVAAGVTCVAWVNVGATPDHGPVYVAEAAKVNAQIALLTTRTDVRVVAVNWDAAVQRDPNLLFDGIHLTPTGKQVRWDAINSGARECDA